MTPTEKYYRIIIGLIRENFLLFLISIVLTLFIDYRDLFGKNSLEVYYVGVTFVILFGILVIIQKWSFAKVPYQKQRARRMVPALESTGILGTHFRF